MESSTGPTARDKRKCCVAPGAGPLRRPGPAPNNCRKKRQPGQMPQRINAGRASIGALGAISIDACQLPSRAAWTAGASHPPPDFPDREHRSLPPARSPPTWPPKSRPPRRRSSRTGMIGPPPARRTWPRGRFDQAASRRAARPAAPGEGSAYDRACDQPAAFPRWNLTKGAGNLAKCPGSYEKSAALAGRRQRVYTPPATPPRRERKRESRRSAGGCPPPGSPADARRPDRRRMPAARIADHCLRLVG